MKKEKRFQDCNKIQKLWRYRWYLLIPIRTLWNWVFGKRIYLHILPDQDDDFLVEQITAKELKKPIYYKNRNFKQLWKLNTGLMQTKMKWWYTSDEVFDNIRERMRSKEFKKF